MTPTQLARAAKGIPTEHKRLTHTRQRRPHETPHRCETCIYMAPSPNVYWERHETLYYCTGPLAKDFRLMVKAIDGCMYHRKERLMEPEPITRNPYYELTEEELKEAEPHIRIQFAEKHPEAGQPANIKDAMEIMDWFQAHDNNTEDIFIINKQEPRFTQKAEQILKAIQDSFTYQNLIEGSAPTRYVFFRFKAE